MGAYSGRAQLLHSEVLDKLHVLLAIALELPEDYFLKIHDVRALRRSAHAHFLTSRLPAVQYSKKSEDHLRYMKYSKFTPEENAKLKQWSRGHTGAPSPPLHLHL
jgi:hypothetical protein